ncbi:DeoR/GlpR family DNA-binding transcription regulator [Paraburkholderia susongensis]|uniref:Transcriptional regulator, DeoR family n=1 Tax=Paraburkholderia susongensis TaxID=1515439 RepID=A0A1X7M2G8_9BURK|nr:DeoR/GlpR family DNA-binding transcription regulator [Paraburkholderia susongensis]SMG60366.1 transcriptional regulator, DeoR family [Paraburkholderia susongensis]
MINHTRRKKLLKILAERGSVTVTELESALSASAATIRRDITVLATSGQLVKVHGGAQHLAPDKPTGLVGSSFVENSAVFPERKRAIARRAAQMCQNGETVIINGGSTTHMMAESLAGSQLTILTNSFLTAHELLTHSSNEILLPGGKIYREQNVIVSPFENDVIQNHYASKMFIGAAAVSPLGLLESDPLLVRAEIQLMKQADELIVLVDSSKFSSKRGGLIVCPLSRVTTLITDSNVSPETVAMLQGQDIEVVVVDPDPVAP